MICALNKILGTEIVVSRRRYFKILRYICLVFPYTYSSLTQGRIKLLMGAMPKTFGGPSFCMPLSGLLRVRSGRGPCPSPETFCISYIKMASFYAFPGIFIDSVGLTALTTYFEHIYFFKKEQPNQNGGCSDTLYTASQFGAPNGGAPCHGTIGTMVNPALRH